MHNIFGISSSLCFSVESLFPKENKEGFVTYKSIVFQEYGKIKNPSLFWFGYCIFSLLYIRNIECNTQKQLKIHTHASSISLL